MQTKTNKSYDQFLEMVEIYNRKVGINTNTGWKYGSVFFNVLSSVRPDLSDMIRNTLHDPTHQETISQKTYDYLASKW